MEDEYDKNGEIFEHEYGDVYKIRRSDGSIIRKLVSQLNGV
jgi:hypothetical protein